MKTNLKKEIENKVVAIATALSLKTEIIRKWPNKNAYEFKFSKFYGPGDISRDCPTLAGLRANNGHGGKLVEALRSNFAIVRFLHGGADIDANFVIGN